HPRVLRSSLYFFYDSATTEIYTLSLHDALPISDETGAALSRNFISKPGFRTVFGDCFNPSTTASVLGLQPAGGTIRMLRVDGLKDRKSTRLNSSHVAISYAVFCLKKKKKNINKK